MVLLKSMKFWLWVAVAVGLAVLALVVRSLFGSTDDTKSGTVGYGGLPPVSEPLQQAVEQAHEEALTAKAESKAVTDEKKKQLSDIGKIPDKKARRQALATFIQG